MNAETHIARSLPFVSVIMPVRNEGFYIQRSLASVLRQDYPDDRYEVIVCDGMSTDDTRRHVQSFSAGPTRVRLLDNPGRIVPTAMNIAMRYARGEIILRVDGHCEIERYHLRRCVEYLTTTDAGGVGGPIETIGETPLAQTIAVAMSSTFGVGGSAFRTRREGAIDVDTIPFPAYWRSVIDRAGPYDEELVRNQDDEYNYRLRKLGTPLLMAGDLLSRYYSRSSLRRLWRQYFQYGYWKVRVLQRHPGQMRARQFVPVGFVTALIIGIVLSLTTSWGGPLLAVIAMSYLLVNVLATTWTLWNRRHVLPGGGWRVLAAPLLASSFAAMHLSYGAGFLVGLARFAGHWRTHNELTHSGGDSACSVRHGTTSSATLSAVSGESSSAT